MALSWQESLILMFFYFQVKLSSFDNVVIFGVEQMMRNIVPHSEFCSLEVVGDKYIKFSTIMLYDNIMS